MKKIFCAFLTLCVVWAGPRLMQMNSASAQMTAFTGGVVPFTNQLVLPLTNQIGFTNTVVQATNPSTLQLSDVETLLLRLQTNIEATLPALAFVTSNVTAANFSATNTTLGPVTPITSIPPSLVPVPNGPGAQPTSFSLRVGTNTFSIDPATLQGLVQLRNDLELALPVLQALNGTSRSPPITSTTPATFGNPTFAFLPGTVTNGFFTPLTNAPPFLAPNVPSAF